MSAGQGFVLHPLAALDITDILIAEAPDEHPLLVIAVLHGHRSPRVMAVLLRA
jgi:hypothetical protein